MRARIAALLAAAMVALSALTVVPAEAAVVATPGAQLLTNASFDRDAGASGWGRMNAGSNWAVLTGNPHDGRSYLRANLGSAPAGASVYQDVEIGTAAGQSFSGSLWVRTDDGSTGTGTLAVWGLGGGGTEGASTTFTATSQWQQVVVPFDSKLAHTSLRLEVYMGSGVQYGFDGASLVQQLLTNGGFDRDAGLSSWNRLNSGSNWAVISSGSHGGSNHMRANLGTATDGASVYQDVPLSTTPGQSFTGSIWVRTDDGSTGTGVLALWGLGGGGTEGSSTAFTATPQWQEVAVPLDTNLAHTALRLEAYMQSGVQYAFDSAQLMPQLLANASFDRDAGLSGWVRANPATNWAVMTRTGHDGTNYMRANLGSAPAGASMYQDVAVSTVAGQSFTGSIWVRSDDGSTGVVTAALWGLGTSATEGSSQNITVTPEWQQVVVSLDTAAPHSSVRFELYMHSSIQYAFDGAELTLGISPAPGAPPSTVPATKASIAVAYARLQIGKPYVWATDGEATFDCSGLTMRSWQEAGVYNLVHKAQLQYNNGAKYPISERIPGDLIFYGTSPSTITHVALYIGGDQIIHAAGEKSGVKYSAYNYSAKVLPYVVRPTG